MEGEKALDIVDFGERERERSHAVMLQYTITLQPRHRAFII